MSITILAGRRIAPTAAVLSLAMARKTSGVTVLPHGKMSLAQWRSSNKAAGWTMSTATTGNNQVLDSFSRAYY